MSGPQRTSIFDDDDAATNEALKPTPRKALGPDELKALDEVAARHNFVSREPGAGTATTPPATTGRRASSGPKVQLNLRCDQGLKARFQAIVDARELRHETVFRMALEALERELAAKEGK
jgi:hypothetical protein